MKNIFIEGIQGTGKSTLANNLSNAIPEFNICREGDYSPIDLAWCTWMSKDDYADILKRYSPIQDEIIKNTVNENKHFIVTYTKIITDIPNFHKEMENYEVYNGRMPLSELKELILTRYSRFKKTGYIFECSFFQNIIEDLMLFHLLDDNQIIEFYRELYSTINQTQFLLLYLYTDNLEASTTAIRKERCDNSGNELWYDMMLQYLIHSPYGVKNKISSFEDMVSHFKHRQQIEMRIIKEVLGDNAIIIPSKGWSIDEILSYVKS